MTWIATFPTTASITSTTMTTMTTSSPGTSTSSSTPSLTVGLLTGGRTYGQDWDSRARADIIGGDCQLPDLPQQRTGHVSFVTTDQLVLVCGGEDFDSDSNLSKYLSSCVQYNLAQERWDHHSDLSKTRNGAAVATLTDGSYILGGFDYGSDVYLDSSEFLPTGSSQWTQGPRPPQTGKDACAVAVSHTSLLLIGGGLYDYDYSTNLRNYTFYRTVWEYSSSTSTWSSWPSLVLARKGHACIKTGHRVIVAGGETSYGAVTRTTEIINLETKTVSLAGDMASPRTPFGMFEVGYSGNSVVLTFGGSNLNFSATTNEEFDPTTSKWRPSPAVMDPKVYFSAVTVEANLVCKPGEI